MAFLKKIAKTIGVFFDRVDRARAANDYVSQTTTPDHNILVQFTKD